VETHHQSAQITSSKRKQLGKTRNKKENTYLSKGGKEEKRSAETQGQINASIERSAAEIQNPAI
jgi:hypothetical protein